MSIDLDKLEEHIKEYRARECDIETIRKALSHDPRKVFLGAYEMPLDLSEGIIRVARAHLTTLEKGLATIRKDIDRCSERSLEDCF